MQNRLVLGKTAGQDRVRLIAEDVVVGTAIPNEQERDDGTPEGEHGEWQQLDEP